MSINKYLIFTSIMILQQALNQINIEFLYTSLLDTIALSNTFIIIPQHPAISARTGFVRFYVQISSTVPPTFPLERIADIPGTVAFWGQPLARVPCLAGSDRRRAEAGERDRLIPRRLFPNWSTAQLLPEAAHSLIVDSPWKMSLYPSAASASLEESREDGKLSFYGFNRERIRLTIKSVLHNVIAAQCIRMLKLRPHFKV